MSRLLFTDRFYALKAPLLILLCTLVVERLFGYSCFTACEDGPVENFQAVLLAFAFLTGLALCRDARGVVPGWAIAFFAIGTLGALYAGLEEISYGQRIFGWVTPETWDQINDQQETNLHNTSAWLDQKPRILLEIGVVVGGLIVPALRRWAPQKLPARWSVIYPSSLVVPTAAFAILLHVYDTIVEAAGHQELYIITRPSEMRETYLYWFMFIYLVFKRREIRARKASLPA